MPDCDQRDAELERTEAGLGRTINGQVRAASAPLRRVLQRFWSRAGRAQVGHQRQIGHGMLEMLHPQRERAARSRSALDELRGELSALGDEVAALRSWFTRIDGELRGMREWLQTASDRTDEVAGRVEWIIAEAKQDRQGFTQEISLLSRRVPDAVLLSGSEAFTLERFDAGLGGEVLGFRDSGSDAEARVYAGFENFFRGPEELIRERQLAYMPLLSRRAPVLDIGCGRGEMLELLGERGVEAAGIDIDSAMVEHCRAKGLERVHLADAVGYLEQAPAGSLGAVFAAQVIEHLPYPSLLRFLRAARRALTPGGLLVVETVNPHAPQALKNFWIDPTHQHPLFPEVVVALCRLTGFAGAYVWHPQGTGDPDRDRVQQLDYAVVAEAPRAAAAAAAAAAAPEPS